MHTRERLGSPERFGYEWSRYSTILPEHRRQLERWLGGTSLASFRDQRVLDVGCGMGRNPYWYAEAGASSVLAIDFDDGSLEVARRNLARWPNVRVERVSVYALDPSVHGVFDRVTCIGVLHHLDDPKRALARMWACVAKGGDLVVWCYAREGNRLFLPAIHALRAVGSRLPLAVTHALAWPLALLTWATLRLVPFRTDYYRHLRTLSFPNLRSIIFDQMIPRISSYWNREEIEALAATVGADRVQLELVQGNSWALRFERE